MSILEVKNLSYSINNKQLYLDANFQVNKEDHLGITGQNGTGKTTLLNIVMGKTEADSGDIEWNKAVKVGYLDQHADVDKNLTIMDFLKHSFDHLFEVEKELNKVYEDMGTNFTDELSEKANELQNKLMYANFYDIEAVIQKTSAGLGITKLGMDKKLGELSGGQRAKVILAKLLLERPDVLIMDEPTNFLDKEHVEWLGNYLSEFEGAFIVISHDFAFLDKITNCIIDIEFKQIKKYTGSFERVQRLKEESKKNYQTEFEKQQREIEHLQKFISRFGAGTRASQAQSRQKQLDKMEVMPPAQSLPAPHFLFKSEPLSKGTILVTKALEVGYDRVLLPPIDLKIAADEKIVISGFNGIGKSTLIKTLVGAIKPLGGEFHWEQQVKIGYFDQELEWDNPLATPFDVIKAHFPKFDDSEARKYLAQCAVKGKIAMQAISTLSGGEQVKVKLCILMLTKCNVLILDEPTNHIDVDSKRVLKEQLIGWEGSIILISHEQDFYEDWATRVVKINKK